MIWDAARVASKRPLPKPRKLHKPVGEHERNVAGDNDQVCRSCGHLICSCKFVLPPYGQTNEGIAINYNAFVPKSQAFWTEHSGLHCGFLTEPELAELKCFVLPLQASGFILGLV